LVAVAQAGETRMRRPLMATSGIIGLVGRSTSASTSLRTWTTAPPASPDHLQIRLLQPPGGRKPHHER